MPRPLPTTAIIAFRDPVVKGGDVFLPVFVHGEWHGLQIVTTRVAAKIGVALVAASKRPNISGRAVQVEPTAEAPRELSPFLKPKGKNP